MSEIGPWDELDAHLDRAVEEVLRARVRATSLRVIDEALRAEGTPPGVRLRCALDAAKLTGALRERGEDAVSSEGESGDELVRLATELRARG